MLPYRSDRRTNKFLGRIAIMDVLARMPGDGVRPDMLCLGPSRHGRQGQVPSWRLQWGRALMNAEIVSAIT